VSQRQKLIQAIRDNPKDVRFDDACKVAKWLGYVESGGKGGHRAFAKPGDPEGLNFQSVKGGKIPAYQARQLIAAIDKHESGSSDDD
jgi:hypothetical protein